MAKPFSKSFNLNTTFYHLKHSVELSIQKCVGAIDENADRKEEILDTLSVLNVLKSRIEDLEREFKKPKLKVVEEQSNEEEDDNEAIS